METSIPRGSHVVTRPMSTAHTLSRRLNGPQGPRLERRQAQPPDIYTYQTGPGYLAAAFVQNIRFGRPRDWSANEAIEPINNKTSYQVELTRYRKKKGDKYELRHDLALFQTTQDNKGEAKREKLAVFRFGSEVKLDVCLLREIQEIRLSKEYDKSTTKIEDQLWTFKLQRQPMEVFRLGHQFWKTFQGCLEKMPLSHLAYANVNRLLVNPAPVINHHSMQSRAKTNSERQSILYHLEDKEAVPTERTSKSSDRKLFKIEVPNAQGHSWTFPGHLSDPLLMARVAELSGGSLSGNSPSEGRGNTTQGAKGKARRRKKAAKAARAREGQFSGDDEPTSKRSAPRSSRQGKKRHG